MHCVWGQLNGNWGITMVGKEKNRRRILWELGGAVKILQCSLAFMSVICDLQIDAINLSSSHI